MNQKIKQIVKQVLPISFVRKIARTSNYIQTKKLSKMKIIPFDPIVGKNGVNLIGNIRLDAGLGQSMRLVARELSQCKIPITVYEHHISDSFSMTDHSCDSMISEELPYNVNLFHINAHEYMKAFLQMGKEKWDRHYNIAFWLWELEDFPNDWDGCINTLDEIWTPAEFVSNAIRKRTNKPVITIPYHVEAPIDKKYDRKYFNIPEDKFLFLMMYDSESMMERKNPVGVLKAFERAFPKENEKVGLVIKLNGNNPKDIATIKSYLVGYTNVYFMTGVLDKVAVNSLIADADVLVSMHRAEGFGLVMAEAMLNGVPCIATNWSANTEFMNSEVACMLEYEMITLEHDIGPFRKGSRWAEPSVAQAAEYMQKLYADREYYEKLSVNARAYIEKKLGMEHITKLIEDRLHEIGIC